MINRLKAHDLAVAANVEFLKGQEAEVEKNKSNKYRNAILRRMKGTYAILKTFLYVCLVIADALVMYNILAIVVTDGMGLASTWAIFFLGVYIVLIVSVTLEIGKGLGKKISKALFKLEVDLEELASPETPFISIESEVKKETTGDYRRAMRFLFGLIVILVLFALVRNYYVHNTSFSFESPTDWINILLPPLLGFIMSYAGIYKGMVFKYFEYKRDHRKYSELAESYYANANEKGKEAIAFEKQALDVYETTLRSKDLNEVLDRYSTHSMLDTHQHRITVSIKRKGFPQPNKQISGQTADSSTILSVTDANGIAVLNWNGESYLVSIVVERQPLDGIKFESGQLISVDLDSLKPPGGGTNPAIMN